MADEIARATSQPESGASGSEKETLPRLTLGQPKSSPVLPKARADADHESEGDPELDSLAASCRAKAEAARGVAERQRRLLEWDQHPDDEASGDPEIRRWAESLTNAYYWAVADGLEESDGLALLDQVGGCFEALAEALRLASNVRKRRGGIERALQLIAEAQSAVRRSLERLAVRDDSHQLAVYEWVRSEAARHRVFLKRYMRSDDLADPEAWPTLLSRIETESGEGAPSRRHKVLFDRLRAQLRSLQDAAGTADDWPAIVEVVEELIRAGLPPSNRELRELLLPHLDHVPISVELPPGVRRVLREIDHFLATRAPGSVAVHPQEPTPEILEAARLLKGRCAVLIGGLRRPRIQESLKNALGLKELFWIGTREHQSIRTFEAAIARPEVALVLLAIRWSSHAFSEIKVDCDRHQKPLVRLPGGYNPAQVAAQILDQCSGQIEGR